jgi:diguanylate cyclase (GGDEF)-like protein
MTDLKTITDILRHNEETARRFFEIEKKILTVLNYTDLFEILLSEIKRQFRVPHVWLSLINDSSLSEFIEHLETSKVLKHRMNLVDRTEFVALVGKSASPLLANDDLKPFYRLQPGDKTYLFKSIAIAPLTLDGETIGSLNQADHSAKRFQPGIDTSLLEQLSAKVSLCLSNVTAHEKLRFLAYHDPLTGLLNRRVMEAILKREYHRTQRYNRNLSVVFVDLDDFKSVNDRYGHDCGDELLIHVADKLSRLSRATDVVARFAGDEFVVILPETDPQEANSLMRRIQADLAANPLLIDGHIIPASVSFGVAAAADNHFSGPSELLKRADEMLYKIKQQKKKGADTAEI